MENPNRVLRSRKKENRPPGLNRDTPPEQRNIQKNVNLTLSLDSFRDVVSHRSSSRAAIPASNCSQAAACGKSPVASIRGAKPHRPILVQTNLLCPYHPSQDTPGGISGGPSWQQSNLKFKPRFHKLENVACVGEPSCLSTVDLGQGGSCLDRAGLTNSPRNDSGRRRCWSQKPRRGLGLWGGPHSCNDISKCRTGKKDPHVLKHPRECFSGLEGSSRTLGAVDYSFWERPSACSFLHGPCLCPESLNSSSSSSPHGPALTLDHLRASTSVEGPPTSTSLHVLLYSSQVSADLHSSIQQFKKEETGMGALSSFPWDSKPVLLPNPPHLDPWVPTSGRLSTMEQFAGEESCAKQASMKWQSPFARDQGLGSTMGSLEELCPVGYACRNTGLYAHPMEASDQFWPSTFYGGVGSTSLVCRREESCSSPSFCNLRYCSRMQEVLERKDLSGHLKLHYQQKRLDPEELSSRFFHSPEVRHGDLPLCLPSFDGLEVSLETSHAGPPVKVGAAVDSTQREAHEMVHSPEFDQSGNGSKYVDLRELQCELAGADGDQPTLQTVDEADLFLPAHNSLEETTGKSLQERSSAAATDHLIPTSFGGSASGPKRSSKDNPWADAGHSRGEKSPEGKNTKSSKFQRCKESRRGMDTVQEETLRRNDWLMDGERNRELPQSPLLLARCFAMWRNQVFGRRAAAEALYRWQLLRKGLGALKWAVELRHVQAGIAQRRHSRTVLAASFRRWQGAMAKRHKERASRVEMEACSKGSLAAPGGEKVAKCPALRQMSAKCLEAATRYGRAEGNLWLHLHHNQGRDKLYGRVQAVRDMRRLAAFRLWRLQEESHDEAESRAREASALLEKKRLRNAFRMWQSHHRATERILPLMAQIRWRLVSQCFDTWKGFAEREARGRRSLDRQRISALRMCFRQWALMVQVRERARKVLLELLALRRRIADARFGFALNPTKTQPHLNIGTPSQRNGPDTLDSLYVALVLQEMFYAWKARWCQQQRLDAFRQAAEQRLLREALKQWRWKAFSLPALRRCTGDLGADPLLAKLDLDGSSASSGFHSNAPALPASSDSLDRESHRTGSSPGSVSSVVTITDSGHFLYHLPPSSTSSPRCREDLGDEAMEFHVQASSPLRNIEAFTSWSVAAARSSARDQDQAWLESIRQQRLLAFCFGRWKAVLWRAQQRREGETLQRRPAGCSTVRRWRKAIRGYQALQRNTGTIVQQSCNYWTKAAAFHLCLKEWSSLIRASKFMKMPLSWPSKQRRSREEGPSASLVLRARLNGSAFHVWLMIYRCQSRVAGPSLQGPPDVPEWRVKHAQVQNSSAEMDSTRWLWRKYLRYWRLHVLLCRFQDAWKMRYLVRAWLLWKDACRTKWVVEALAREKLTQWGWKAWRRRYLQTQVAERFLEAQDRILLKRAFETWRHLAAKASHQPQGSF